MRRFLILGLLVSSLVGVTGGVLAQPENPRALVRDFYHRYLGREPDAAGAQYWVDQLQGGADPADVAASFLGSDEFYQRAGSTPEGFVQALFQKLGGRQPSPAELRFWKRSVWQAGRKATAQAVMNRVQQAPPVPAGENPPQTPPP